METRSKRRPSTKPAPRRNASLENYAETSRRQARSFRSMVNLLEEKYTDFLPDDNNVVVDINNLDVVHSGTKGKKAVKRGLSLTEETTLNQVATTSRNVKPRCSTVRYVNVSDEIPNNSLSIYQPAANSKLFDQQYQVGCLKEALKLIKNGDEVLRNSLISKAQQTLGLSYLPNAETVHPIFQVHDSGKIAVIFLYDDPPFTTVKAFMNHYYSKAMLSLSKELYEFLLVPAKAPVASIKAAGHQTADSALGTSEPSTSDDSEFSETDYSPIPPRCRPKALTNRARKNK